VHPAVTKLLSISGEPLSPPVGVDESTPYLSKWGTLGKELAETLNWKNGFYAFESALLVRPLQNAASPLGLREWNAPELWKGKYVENLADVLFFAEDAFGGQFCIRDQSVCTFDPETGLLEVMGSSLGAWANEMLADSEFRTGYPLAHAWQARNGPLPTGVRLLPKMPFVCGGKYEVENLYPLDEVKGMQFRASIANQIRDLPDGAQITFEIAPPGP
jgi:hypothetical protein